MKDKKFGPSEIIRFVEAYWNEAYPDSENSWSYVAEVEDDVAIVKFTDEADYWAVPYTIVASGEVTFQPRALWIPMIEDSRWVAKGEEIALLRTLTNPEIIDEPNLEDEAIKFDIDAPCKHKAVKIIDEEDRRIGMYATIWGELDCDGERMTREAVEPYVGKGTVPLMLWLHGLDKEFGSNPPGTWDASSFVIDDVGLYAEGNINTNEYGDKAWERIKSAGSYGGSLGSIWYLVQRGKASDGSVLITNWPLLEISIMEGGKQCVPNAMRSLTDKGLEGDLLNLATKMGVEFEVEENAEGLRRIQLQARISLS